MSGVLNDCDALLQGASVRIVNPKNAWIDLNLSAPGFHLTGAGVADLAVVTVTADLFGLDEAVAFSAVGGTLSNANGKSVDVAYAGSTAVVTATVVSGGEEFKRSIVIPVLRDGAAGAAGQVAYTWIKYADTAAGVGLSDDPAGKAYIGLAYNKSTSVESTTPGDYAWSQLKGGDGVAGAKGADGVTYYTWIKYADQADGTGLYDAPNASTLYIGIAVNRTTATESTTKTDYVWSRFKGEQGVAGAPTYTWIKYADDATGAGLSDDPTGKVYVGFAYNKGTAVESDDARLYAWSLIKGTDGQPGGKGADGATLYTWIKYSDVADGTGLYDLPTASTLFIGIATNKSTATESTVKTDYVWSKFKGDQGVQGPTTYTWVKYADSAAGAGLSDDPTGKAYIGFAYNKATATESTTASDYTWSLIKGTDGQPGGKGADGATLYTWIKYSDNADGTGLYDLPTASTQYLGIAVNKPTATESTVKTDYVWSKFRGADGVGTAGARGAGHYYVAGSSWSDVVAQAACPGGPVTNDVVTISSGTFVMEKRWTGSAWVENGVVINGKLIVPDSILVSSIDTRGLLIRATAGNGGGVIIDENGLRAGFEAPDTKNSELVPRIPVTVTLSGRGVAVTGNTIAKTGGTNGAWDADCASVESYTDGASCSAHAIAVASGEVMFGLNQDPAWDRSYISLDFAIYLTQSGQLMVYRDGNHQGTFGTWSGGDFFEVQYTGAAVTYYKNGTQFFTHAAPTGLRLFFDCSIAFTNGSLKNIGFGPMSSNAAGVQALAAIPAINTSVADKLSKSAANIMSGAGALVSGNLTVDANGYRTGGYGCAQTQRGWVSYNSSGVLTFQLDAAGGNPYFAGQVAGAYGTFGAVSIAAGGKLTVGQATTFGGEGVFLGYVGSVVKMSIVSGSAKLLYDPSSATPLQIVNPAMQLTARTVTISSDQTFFSHIRSTTDGWCGTHTAAISGAISPSYLWVGSEGGLGTSIRPTNPTGQQTGFLVTGPGGRTVDPGTTLDIDFQVTCLVSDGGASKAQSNFITVSFS